MADGIPSFSALAERMHVRDPRRAEALAAQRPVTFLVFDVLRLYGVDLTRSTYDERRETLRRLELPDRVELSPSTPTARSCGRSPGRWASRASSPSGGRPPTSPAGGRRDWVKAPHRRTRAALVGGWREETTGSGRMGAVLFGARDADGALRYLGRAGSGLTGQRAAELQRLLRAARRLPVRRRGACCRRARHALVRADGRRRHPVPHPQRPPAGCVSRSCGACAPTPTPTPGSSHDTRTADGRRRGPAGARQPPGEGHVPVDRDDQGRGHELPGAGRPGDPARSCATAPSPGSAGPTASTARSSSRRTRRAGRRTGCAGRPCGRRPGADDEGAELELPFLDDLAGLVWAANQGALELHTPQWRVGPARQDPPPRPARGRPGPGRAGGPGRVRGRWRTSSRTGCARTASTPPCR